MDPMVTVDFDENKVRGCDKRLSDSELSLILDLLEKYNVYLWNFNNQCENMNEIPRPLGFGGRLWGFELIFEDDKVFAVGGNRDYPDTYLVLGEEIIKLFGKDILRLEYIHFKEKYKKYGDNHSVK